MRRAARKIIFSNRFALQSMNDIFTGNSISINNRPISRTKRRLLIDKKSLSYLLYHFCVYISLLYSLFKYSRV